MRLDPDDTCRKMMLQLLIASSKNIIAIALLLILSACMPLQRRQVEENIILSDAGNGGGAASSDRFNTRAEQFRGHFLKVCELYESLAHEIKSTEPGNTDPALRALLAKTGTSVVFRGVDYLFLDHYRPIAMSLDGEMMHVSPWDVYGLSQLTRQIRSESALAWILPLATHLIINEKDCLVERMILMAGIYNALLGRGPWARLPPNEMAGDTRLLLKLFNDEVVQLRKKLESSSNGPFEKLSSIWLDLLVDGKPLTMEMLNFVGGLDGLMTHTSFHTFFASAVLFEQISKTEYFTHLRTYREVWLFLVNCATVDKTEEFVTLTEIDIRESDRGIFRVGPYQYLVLASIALMMDPRTYVDIVSTRDMIRRVREHSDE